MVNNVKNIPPDKYPKECPRCKGIIARDEDGKPRCLLCNRRPGRIIEKNGRLFWTEGER